MNAERAGIDELPSPAAWLLERGVQGLGLTKTYALQRAVVREAAERWPQWWNHELFGPPHREAELPVLEATHAALRRMRLLRRQRETLRTTAQGGRCSRDPDALCEALHEDLSAGGDFEAAAWSSIEGALQQDGPLPTSSWSTGSSRRCCATRAGARRGGAPIDGRTLRGELQPLLWLAEGYGLLRRSPRGAPLTLELTAAGHRLAAGAWAGEHRRLRRATPRSCSTPCWSTRAASAPGWRCWSASR